MNLIKTFIIIIIITLCFSLLAADPGLCLRNDNYGWNWIIVLPVNADCWLLFLLLPVLWEMWWGDVPEG